jgi:chromosome condensin MukBEF MukE localization factor
LDKAVQRLTAICSLEQNNAFQPLMDSIQNYLNIVFEENKIEETYKEIIQAYKKFFFLRSRVASLIALTLLGSASFYLYRSFSPCSFNFLPSFLTS